MILVLSFEKTPDSHVEGLLYYGTTVGFSIIVSGQILKKQSRDKMEILNNVLAVILFTAVGIIRINKYNSASSTEQLIKDHLGIDLSDFSTGEILQSNHNISTFI